MIVLKVTLLLLLVSNKIQTEERQVTIEELLDAEEVFCTGTAVVLSPVGSITYREKRLLPSPSFITLLEI